jgi:hypothetical protein
MTRWEYRFIDLYRGTDHKPTAETAVDFFRNFIAEVRQAGEEGWEAVGELGVTYGAGMPPNSTRIGALLLKRPVDG